MEAPISSPVTLLVTYIQNQKLSLKYLVTKKKQKNVHKKTISINLLFLYLQIKYPTVKLVIKYPQNINDAILRYREESMNTIKQLAQTNKIKNRNIYYQKQ